MEENILKQVYDAVAKNEAIALVTLIEVKGSTPRDAGSIMAVYSDGRIIGSIGGGPMEYEVIKEALDAINKGESKEFNHALTPQGEFKAQCGGYAKGYIKVFNTKSKLIIAGGGHIGKKLLELGKFLGFYCIIVDNREEYKTEKSLQIADEIIICDYSNINEFLKIDENSYIVVVTQNCYCDFDCVKNILDKNFKYLGVIGSKSKQNFIRKSLKDSGFNDILINKIYGPTGLDISNQLPEEIAFSILSEILLIKNNGKLVHKKDKN
ncbi:XdhC family protein [Campylobacter sp. MG1]|uniref:XdhC family protein n=1 Tax=Campylobacter sp. MG1 TaxID=2976332 RepID=UPI00226C65DF|nr:XdhC/CoxI family protein [Campylobacter sp. MG1]